MTDIAYSLTTYPHQLQASPHQNALTLATLTITLSTDSLTPVPISSVTVTVPVGADKHELAAAGTPITPLETQGWMASSVAHGVVTFTPPPNATLTRGTPVALSIRVAVNTRPGRGVVELTENASNRAVPLQFRKATPLEPLLEYTLQPLTVHVSETQGTPRKSTFDLVVTNHQAFPVELSSLVIDVPTGAHGNALTEDTVIDVQPPAGWKKTGESLTFVPPPSLTSLAPGHAITFSIEEVTVNREVGTATLSVYECGKDQEFPACPSYDIDIAKFPLGTAVGNVELWIVPPLPQRVKTPVTVRWSGPQGPTYTLYQDADLIGTVANEGEHCFTLEQATWLTLDVAMAVGTNSTHATVQLYVSVPSVSLEIEWVKATVDRAAGLIELCWQTNKEDGQCTFDDVDQVYPLNGRRRGIRFSTNWPGVTMKAKDFAGDPSVSALITLGWVIVNQFEPQVYRADTGWSSLGKSPAGKLQIALSRRHQELLWTQHSTFGACALPTSAATQLKQDTTLLVSTPSNESAGVYGLAPLAHLPLEFVVLQLRQDDGSVGNTVIIGFPWRAATGLEDSPSPYLSHDGRQLVASTADDQVLVQAATETRLDLYEMNVPLHLGYDYSMSSSRSINFADPITAIATAPDRHLLYVAHGTWMRILDLSGGGASEAQDYKCDALAAVTGIAVSANAVFVATPAGIRVFDRDVTHIRPGDNLNEIGDIGQFVARDVVVTDDGQIMYAVDATGYKIVTLARTGAAWKTVQASTG
jgi:hypothetical protein